jgi:DNA-binding MarR family transcriptional regulator
VSNKDENDIAKIKELWVSGVHIVSKIAEEIGYSKATVPGAIKKMKERHELV